MTCVMTNEYSTFLSLAWPVAELSASSSAQIAFNDRILYWRYSNSGHRWTMKLLKDDELVQLITRNNPIVTNLNAPTNWYSVDSAIQPSSVDLHIGKIYVPETPDPQPGCSTKPIQGNGEQFVLKVGQTAIVSTLETVELPSNIAAFGFPPTLVSARGILMTNPGHIDPGFRGDLRFTVINMGRKDFALVPGEPIVTLLFVELSGNATADYSARHPGIVRNSSIEGHLNKLSMDFLDVGRRATDIANSTLSTTTWRVTILGTLFTAIIGGIVTGGVYLAQRWHDAPLKDIQNEIKILRKEIEIKGFNERLNKAEKRIESLGKAPDWRCCGRPAGWSQQQCSNKLIERVNAE